MIKTLLALALVLPVPVQYDTVPSLDWMDAPYTFIGEPCEVLADTAPGLSDWCEGAVVLNASLDRQIANGSFRFWLYDGEMWQNSYVGRFGYSYFDDAILQSARVTMQLVCVDTVTGDIEANGAPYTVIANKEDPQVESAEGGVIARDNAGPVALSSDGPCRLGWNREVMTVAVMSDAQAVGWTPGDQEDLFAGAGWAGGTSCFPTVGGEVCFEVSHPNATTWLMKVVANGATWVGDTNAGTVQTKLNAFFGTGGTVAMDITKEGAGSEAPNLNNFTHWWTSGGGGRSEWTYTITNPTGGDIIIKERNNLLGFPPIEYRSVWADEFQPEGVVYISGTLTRYGPVEDLQWLPQEQPLTIFDVDGVCEEVGTCIERCDAPGLTWNPLAWWNDLREYLTCLVVPTVDITEFTQAARTDLGNSLAMQSIDFGVDRMQNLIAIPGFVSKPCGKLIEISVMQGHTQAFSTCDISPEVRGHISAAVVIIFTGAALFTVMRLLFWAFGWEVPSVFKSTDRDDD